MKADCLIYLLIILSPSPKMCYLGLEHVFYYLTLILPNHVVYEVAAPSDNSKYLSLLIVQNKRLLYKTINSLFVKDHRQECCMMCSPLS